MWRGRRLPEKAVPGVGLAAGLAGAALLASGELVSAAGCILLGQLTDASDGALARRLRAESVLGARLDWAADTAVATARRGSRHVGVDAASPVRLFLTRTSRAARPRG